MKGYSMSYYNIDIEQILPTRFTIQNYIQIISYGIHGEGVSI